MHIKSIQQRNHNANFINNVINARIKFNVLLDNKILQIKLNNWILAISLSEA
jgi:hypothetical protein